jgi:hypothetical protein
MESEYWGFPGFGSELHRPGVTTLSYGEKARDSSRVTTTSVVIIAEYYSENA